MTRTRPTPAQRPAPPAPDDLATRLAQAQAGAETALATGRAALARLCALEQRPSAVVVYREPAP